MTVPNILSIFRLILVPVFAVIFFQPWPNAHPCAALVYLVAFLTDIADGWIARHFNQVTRLGRILDPMADKLMTFTVIICITVDEVIPLWAVIVFFCKELCMAIGGYIMYRKLGDVIPSNWLGKLSTGVFFVVCGGLVLFPGLPRPCRVGLIGFALALTLAALCGYIYQFCRTLRERKPA
ncbi:CDP-alcohol phosphatidyltransferase family protein [Flavonifractor sp. AGMB03687]|uniref:CDP-alcohol phosphatidyltransferase family protein n=1 Tax=Flavonifractor sp. AGMB03687 TaxID=2785133 RepID=UPI001ADF7EF5|nr:CDP-alcohol phosphatidyltransferase family protein [Flavonifractor sp. AGMB03687]